MIPRCLRRGSSLFSAWNRMEKALIILFLVLFAGRFCWRYVLQQLNISNLQKHGKEIPPVFQGVIDEGTLTKMVDYTVDNTRLAAKENLVDDLVELALVFLFLPFFVSLITAGKIPFIGQALIFFGVFAAVGGVCGIPFELYSTFVLEKKYGFSTITWRMWFTDLLKSLIISSILLAVLISAIMAFIFYLPASWWLWAWVFFTLFQILLLWIYPVVIAPLFNKYEPITDKGLQEQIEAMMAKVGLKAQGIYQVDEGKRSRHTNAYFTGIGKTKRIVLYDTLLASHTTEEIISVLAHEIGHWKKKHIFKQLVFMIAASLAVLYFVHTVVSAPVLYHAFGLTPTPLYAGLFLVSLYLSCLGFFLSPAGAAIMRRYEREADRTAVELTGTSTPMISALKRLAKDNLANLHPHPLYVWFYYSHPPLLERITNLQDMKLNKENAHENN
ncbi:MAG: peptidase M48 [Deltaproteobacteria bacterium HGW-Deltaproteobacteria-12]|nr:MAG: peptidase M48 [Deltaproteobacteria bacterium HGW-Deltaproteobacteria-12]